MTAKEQAEKSLDNLNLKLLYDDPKWKNRNPTEEGLVEFAKFHAIRVLKTMCKTELEYQRNIHLIEEIK